MAQIPKSVAEINKYPHWSRFYGFGSILNNIITASRDIYSEFATGGSLFTLINELRTRLDTLGDYQVLISALRAEHIAAGQISDILIDLSDKAFNQILTDPTWQQNTGGGGNTRLENAAAINAVVDGVYIANVYAATQDIVVDAGSTTGAGEYRAITLSVTAGGTLNQTVSAISASAPVTPPRPPSGECPVGVIQIPASYTPGTTPVQTAWCTDGFPRRLGVYTPMTTADVAAISASALTTKASTYQVDTLPDTVP